MKTTAELTQEIQCEEERLLAVRRRIWQGRDVAAREVIETGMTCLDYLCKLSARIDKERNVERLTWLQQSRRSLRSQLREYWGDALEQRRDIRAKSTAMSRVG